MTENVKIKQGDEEAEVSLADIAGIDMNAVEEFEGGFEPTPKGVYLWNCTDALLDSVETKNGLSAVIRFDLECVECYAIMSDDKDEESMVGWKHQETIFVGDLAKSVGQAKFLMMHAGFTGSGTLEKMLDAFVGTQFIAPVKQRKDKNDTDRVYANIVIAKVTPPHANEVPVAEATAPAPASLVG